MEKSKLVLALDLAACLEPPAEVELRAKTPTPRLYYPMEAEFDLINSQTLTHSARKRLVSNPVFARLNRYADVLPFAHNIVALDDSAPLGPENYINASLITHPFGQSPTHFIACQAPMKHTMEAFCRMIVHHGVTEVIAIISKKEECSRYFDYWHEGRQYGAFKLTVPALRPRREICKTGTLKIVEEESKKEHTFRHVHIDAWKDYNALAKDSIGSFVELLRGVRSDAPIIVHCSAGVGRTFSFICSYYLVEQQELLSSNPTAKRHSVRELVRGLRQQRYNAINTFKQYRFLHDVLHFLEEEAG